MILTGTYDDVDVSSLMVRQLAGIRMKSSRWIVCAPLLLVLSCAGLFYLWEQCEKVRTQMRLVAAVQKSYAHIEYYDDRCPVPYWIVRLFFGRTISAIRKIDFDFEEHPDLTRIRFSEFEVLDQLEMLHANCCGFQGKDLRFLSKLPKLKSLDLCGGLLGHEDFQALSRFPALEELNLCATEANDDDARQIGKISTLKTLHISGGQHQFLSDQGLASLKPLTKLEHLSFYEQPITDAGLETIGHFHHLKSLDLCRCRIQGSGFVFLLSCPQLAWLRLFDVHDIDDSDLQIIGKMTSLESLCMSECPITDAGLEQLHSLSKLQLLWVVNTNVTNEGVTQLKESLPSLQFVDSHGKFSTNFLITPRYERKPQGRGP